MKYIKLLLLLLIPFCLEAQDHSVAREWNELNLNAIRNDFARPTVTARNLWHVSAGMYDAWAAYDLNARPYFLGNTVNGFFIPYNGVVIPSSPEEIEEAREEAVSYAAYRILSHRYENLPSTNEIAVLASFDNLMNELGYATDVTSIDYENGSPAALGNYIAEQIIEFGLQDGSFEDDGYDNQYYEEVNPPLITQFDGNPDMIDPNRWQPLTLIVAIDQAGNPLPYNTPDFLSPEWGNVTPFSLTDEDKTIYNRDENFYQVYCDPGPPAYMDSTTPESGITDEYKWNHAMVAVWSSLLAHDNGVMIDASPNNIGNAGAYPETSSISDLEGFYNYFDGLDSSEGYAINPATGMPYETQTVPLGDYGRVLAEFWADGPDSETPPGHWYSILNYVNDNPLLEKKWNGEGDVLNDLEWDVKSYFALGGAMHDCAIAAWGIKGWYDYVRPISAIRYMADRGQSSDQNLPNYNNEGLPLIPQHIELVYEDDPLVGVSQENLHKIKVKAWKGPDYLDQLDLEGEIIDGIQDSTIAGVDWVLAENWWPYQRPSFVSPPFAGYVSGHSTYSRAAAEILESITGDEYFPGGMGIFDAPQNDFLVFETGPSVDIELQWAKYKDASDQCSLSRIFGGIHPPVDDIPGRKIGFKIGQKVYEKVNELAYSAEPWVALASSNTELINDAFTGTDLTIQVSYNVTMNTSVNPTLTFAEDLTASLSLINSSWVTDQLFEWTFSTADASYYSDDLEAVISGAQDIGGVEQIPFTLGDLFIIDTENPTVETAFFGAPALNLSMVGTQVNLLVNFSEDMSSGVPFISFINDDPTVNSLSPLVGQNQWLSDTQYAVAYVLLDAGEELNNIQIELTGALTDLNGNSLEISNTNVNSVIDTQSPALVSLSLSTLMINEVVAEDGTFSITLEYDDEMGDFLPNVFFPQENPENTLFISVNESGPAPGNTYEIVFDVSDFDVEVSDLDFIIAGLRDNSGNPAETETRQDAFSIDTKGPLVEGLEVSLSLITEAQTGMQLVANIEFDQLMNVSTNASFDFEPSFPASLELNPASGWISDTTYILIYDIADMDDQSLFSGFVAQAEDPSGNQVTHLEPYDLLIDNKGPQAIATSNTYNIVSSDSGDSGFEILVLFDDILNTDSIPEINFPVEDPASSITLNTSNSGWFGTAYRFVYDVEEDLTPLAFIDVTVERARDTLNNAMTELILEDYFSIELDTFLVIEDLSFNQMKVFPNPIISGKTFTIEGEDLVNFDLVVYDSMGRIIPIESKKVNQNQIEISTTSLPSGKYFIKLNGVEDQRVLRIEIL